MSTTRDDTKCACGHVFDEHDPKRLNCEVKDCPCFYFEAADLDDGESDDE